MFKAAPGPQRRQYKPVTRVSVSIWGSLLVLMNLYVDNHESICIKLSVLDNSRLDQVLKVIGNETTYNGNFLYSLIKTSFNTIYFEANQLSSFKLDSILPETHLIHKNGYYTYMGSLTTPPCTEGVVWVISESKISISIKQVFIQSRWPVCYDSNKFIIWSYKTSDEIRSN